MNFNSLEDIFPGSSILNKKYYRLVAKYYAHEIDEIAHTVLYSWRYNPKGEFGVLYLSITPDCAYREILKQVHGREKDLTPLVLGTFEVNIYRCLDLTISSIQEKLSISHESLITPYDFTITQKISRKARNSGYEAIHAPSAIGKDCSTLVIFKDKLIPPSSCIYDKESIVNYP